MDLQGRLDEAQKALWALEAALTKKGVRVDDMPTLGRIGLIDGIINLANELGVKVTCRPMASWAINKGWCLEAACGQTEFVQYITGEEKEALERGGYL